MRSPTIDRAALVTAADLYAELTGGVDDLALGKAILTYQEAQLDHQASEEARADGIQQSLARINASEAMRDAAQRGDHESETRWASRLARINSGDRSAY